MRVLQKEFPKEFEDRVKITKKTEKVQKEESKAMTINEILKEVSKQVQELGKKALKDPEAKKEFHLKKQELKKLMKQRDIENAKRTAEEQKKKNQNDLQVIEQKVNPEHYMIVKDWFSFILMYDNSQSPTVQLHPQLHMMIRKSKAQVKHLLMYVARRHGMDINEYRKYRLSKPIGMDQEGNPAYHHFENHNEYLIDVLDRREIIDGEDLYLAYSAKFVL